MPIIFFFFFGCKLSKTWYSTTNYQMQVVVMYHQKKKRIRGQEKTINTMMLQIVEIPNVYKSRLIKLLLIKTIKKNTILNNCCIQHYGFLFQLNNKPVQNFLVCLQKRIHYIITSVRTKIELGLLWIIELNNLIHCLRP